MGIDSIETMVGGMVISEVAERLTTPAIGVGEAVGHTVQKGIAVNDLELWRGEHCVCRNLSLYAGDGQLVHLRGANGAGKTSLIRVLAGLSLPENGEIRLDGESVLQDMNGWRASLCYVGHSDGVKRELTPRENLRLTARLLAGAPSRNVYGALERVGMAAHAERLCAELSAGQRRRTALARLLVSHARIWLLDEPLVSLDRSGARMFEDLLREHLQDGGIAVVATHQPIDFAGLDVVPVDLPQGRGDSC